MKQITLILSLLFAFGTLHAAPFTAPKDTVDQYIINNKPVEHFDGLQLEGKTIISYKIVSFKNGENGIRRVHEIWTENESPSDQPAYVIDGKQVSKRKFENLSPGRIKSITVVKNGTPEEVRQYKGWENGVILVETKEDKSAADSKDTRINIGYGESNSRDITYAVGSVKSSENEYYTDMYEYLRGKVAGVLVKPDNTIVIRGVTTMNASTAPLILLDGVEINDIGIVNPNDVYSVDILKDASTSIYGIKGANGVILITTKGRHAMDKAAR